MAKVNPEHLKKDFFHFFLYKPTRIRYKTKFEFSLYLNDARC
jgi:hypothetical protein